MKVIIAGGRDVYDYDFVKQAIEEGIASLGITVTEVVSGKAPGVDTLGEQWAEENGIPIKDFPADWNRLGKAAGPIRNGEMAKYGEVLICVPAPASKGSIDMIKQANANGLKVFVKPWNP